MRLIFLSFILFFLSQEVSSQKYNKAFEIAEKYFDEGKYNKAYEHIGKTIKKLKRNRKGLAIVQAQMRSLKYLIALGKYGDFEALLAQVLKKKAYKGENHILYAKAILDASTLYLHYSDILTAENYLVLAEDILTEIRTDKDGNKKIDDSYFDAVYLENKVRILHAKGAYKEASALLPELKEITTRRIIAKETFFNEASLKFTEHKLSTYQLKNRKRKLADIFLLEAEIQKSIGNYKLAQELLQDATIWIKVNLNSKDLAYLKAAYAEGLLMIDREESPKEIRKYLEKLLFTVDKELSPIHHLYLAIHETLIDQYIATYHHRSKLEQWEIRTNTSKYFGKENAKHTVSTRLDAKKNYYNKDFNNALSKLEKLYKDKQKVPENHQERIKVIQQLYQVTLAQDNYDKAFKYLNELKKAQQNIIGENALQVYYTDMLVADFYLNYTSNFNLADSLFKNTLYKKIISTITTEHKDYTYFLQQHADYFEILGNYKRAKELHQQVLDIKEGKFGKDHINYAASLNRMINIELTMGEFNTADKNIDKMLDIFEINFDRKIHAFEYSQALETAARFYALMGLFGEAENFLSLSRRFNEKTINARANSSAVDELAYLYIKTERFRQAETMLLEAKAVRKERYGDSTRFLINPYNQLARLSQIHGDYLEAEEYVNEAQDIAAKIFGDSSYQIIESLIIHAEIDNAIGDYDGAEALLKKAIAIERKILGDNHIELADTYSHLALTKLYNKAPYEEVEELMKAPLEIIEQNLGNNNPIYAEALKNLALINIESHKLDEAIKNLEASNLIWMQRLGTLNNTNSAEIELLLGEVELKKGEFNEAVVYFRNAQNIFKKIFNTRHPEYVKATAEIGRAYFMLDKFKKSKKYTEEVLANYTSYINEFFPALSEREKARFWNKIRDDFEFFNNLSITKASNKKNKKLIGEVYNNTMSTKSLLLSSSIKVRNQILNSNDSSLIKNYQSWTEKKELLTKVLAMSQEQLKETDTDPKQLEKEIEEIEKELSSQSAIFDQSAHHSKSDWKELQKRLKKGEAAIEIIRYRYFDKSFTDSVVYAALIVKPKAKHPELVILPKGNLLETNYLRYYRYCIIYNVEDENSYNYFWKPIHDQLPESTKIYLSSEGVFNQINLEAIRHHDGKFIIDHNDIVLLGNTYDLIDKKEISSKKSSSVSLFGNPVFYKDLTEDAFSKYNERQISQLPGTQFEVSKLDSLLKNSIGSNTEVYVNKAATEDQVKALQSPKIFHIATHGFFMPDEEHNIDSKIDDRAVNNPLLRSGLLLSNAGDLMATNNVYSFNKESGVLTAYEAMSLNLDNTELVVLSACETGRGENKVGEGVYGLQRSFLVAGAESIIMSLFKVSDEATQELMFNFYKNWLLEKMDKRKAFREAKRELMNKFGDPIFWGAFVMIGSS